MFEEIVVLVEDENHNGFDNKVDEEAGECIGLCSKLRLPPLLDLLILAHVINYELLIKLIYYYLNIR
jgi:hypothetical protein